DALAAAEAGADYLGFVLWSGSQRAVEPAVVQAITAHLRQLPDCPLLVGVFVNEPTAIVAHLLDRCGLDLAQLHGDEPPAVIGEPTSPLYGRAYKALRPTSLAEAEADAEWYLPPQLLDGQPALLIDAYHPNLRGGTGQTADWHLAAHLSATIPRLMLAGGLTPDNVAQAVREVRPYAVDVSSGVESSPGRKDHKWVRAFVAAAQNAGLK
ncbi:MAG: phosphoribosylanthranilate isomerase, partial [Chloroflexota bacterium]